MSSPENQEHLKKAAKAIKARIDKLLSKEDDDKKMLRSFAIYAGMMSETLLEYDEPDLVMEQVFHRISDLLESEPFGAESEVQMMPTAYELDHDAEIGRMIARNEAEDLPKYLDDIHEIAIGLIINEVPLWEDKGYSRENMLLLLVEMVITAIIYEISTQDFCDMIIEDYIAGDDTRSISESLLALSVVLGHSLARATETEGEAKDIEDEILNVMVRESLRHGTPGSKNWSNFAASNDLKGEKVPTYLNELDGKVCDFFDMVGQDEPMARVVSIAKAVGRMVAVISVEDIGQIHPNVAKSIAKTGMVLGLNYKEEVHS